MLDRLACPACGGTLKDEAAVLRCRCSAWPVVEGIPLFVPWARNRRPTLEEALARYLPPPRGLLGRILRRLVLPTGPLRAAVADPAATFVSLAASLGRTADLDYFRYRFSELSYLSSAAFYTPLDRGPVLDLGCGGGHLMRALSRKVPHADLTGLDLSFSLVYLARRFVVPDARFVCADASARLPFQDGAFEAAVCADTFNYLPDRARTASELLRVARGPLLLPRLADPSFRGRDAEPPLEPSRYLELFAARSPALHPDRKVLDTFLNRRALDLTSPGGTREEVLSLAAGVEAKVYPGADYFVGGARLNPIYEVREEGPALRLKRRFISERYSEVYRAYDAFLPDALTVTREQVAAGDPGLAARFVLLNLPDRYS